MRSRTSIRDFALAAFVVAGIAIIQAGPQIIPASHVLAFGNNSFGGPGIGIANISANGISPTGVLGKERFARIDGGANTSIAISASGLVSTWGYTNAGLGYSVAGNSQPFPKQISFAPGRTGVSVSAGSQHMLAALDDGSVWSWGANNGAGELGRAGLANLPQTVPGLSDIRKVAAGTDFSLAIDATGHLFGWGANQVLQLSEPGVFTTPVPIDGPMMQDVAAGVQHAVAIATDGSVWAWGGNQFGQAGQDPATAGTSVSMAQVPGLANIVAVAAGEVSSYALAADGSLWAWGRESEIGIGSANGIASSIPRQVIGIGAQPLSGVTGIASGLHYGVASLDNGQYVYWGLTSGLALGLSTSGSGSTIARVGAPAGASVAGVAAGDTHGFLLVDDPPITSSWQLGASMTCSATNAATVTLNGYSLAGLGLTDVMLVLDESGSINPTEFDQLQSFATNFVNQLDMKTTRVGIVMFSDTARLILSPSGNRTQILAAINSVTQAQGNTCIGCGLNTADQSLDQNNRGATRYIVVVTDGQNNVPSQGNASQQQQFLQNAVTNAHQQNKVLSVGVGDQVDLAELAFVASDIPGFETVFAAADFTVLDDLVIDLVRSVIRSPGSTNAHFDVDLGPSWNIVSGTSTVTGSTFTKVGTSSFTWSLPSLDTAAATLQLVLSMVSGGGQVMVPSSEMYTDDQGNAFVPGPQRGVLVSGCPSTFSLTPVSSSSPINTSHNVSATLIDHFGAPIVNAPVQFKFVGGPRSGATIAIVNTNVQGVATVLFASGAPFTDEVQATLVSNPAYVSNTATHTWLPLNTAPVANAGPDQTVALSGSPTVAVTLDASGSTDDGQKQPLSYHWSSNTGFTAIGVAPTLQLPLGVHVFTLSVHDGQFTTVDGVLINVIDPTPPVVTADVAGTPGPNGWYVTDVSLSWTIDDPESGIGSATGCPVLVLVGDTAGTGFNCTATNGAGAQTTTAITIKRDATPPSIADQPDITVQALGPDGAAVTFGPLAVTDATSGPAMVSALCAPPSGSTFSIGTTPVTCTASDNAGHAATSTFNVIVNDPTPPVIVPSVVGAFGDNGWYRGDVSVSWSVSDPNSGIGSSSGCDAATVTTDTASATFTCTATNNAGVAASVSTMVMRDATPPVVAAPANLSASAITAAGAMVSYPAATATDATSGVQGSVRCAPASGSQFPIGTTQVTCTIDDAAGNTGSSTFDISVADTTPPVISPVVTGTPGSNGWFTSPVQIAWTVNDPQSSVATTGCDPVTLTADTPGVTVTCSATSAGGSSSLAQAVKIDTTAPVIMTPGALSLNTPSLSGAEVTYAASGADAASGLAGGVSCAPASGATFPIGATTVTCSASDNAGNSSSASFTVTLTFGSDEPGQMHGEGHVIVDSHRVAFDFAVVESRRRGERSRVELRITRGRNGRWDDDRFDSRTVEEVVFTDAPAYAPGKHPKSGIDTVVFIGTGKWDRRDGYTYTVTASDRGEPGRSADTFTIEVKAPNGQVVFSGGGAIADGNVQSNRVKR